MRFPFFFLLLQARQKRYPLFLQSWWRHASKDLAVFIAARGFILFFFTNDRLRGTETNM